MHRHALRQVEAAVGAARLRLPETGSGDSVVGHRRFTDVSSDDSDDGTHRPSTNSGSATVGGLENVLMVWRFQHKWMALEELVDPGNEEACGAPSSTEPETVNPKQYINPKPYIKP